MGTREPPNASFRKLGVITSSGLIIIRILLFRVLHQGPLFSETPKTHKPPRDPRPEARAALYLKP